MCTKKYSAVLMFVIGAFCLQAQTPQDNIVAGYNKAVSSLVLLKNEGALIPLQRLDTLRVAFVSIGLTEGCDFQRILERYTKVDAPMPPGANEAAPAEQWAKKLAESYNLFVLGINDYENFQRAPEYIRLKPYIQALIDQGRTISVVFGGRQAFDELNGLHRSEGLILTPFNEYAHSLAAQLIFGGVGAKGTLDKKLGAYFKAGDGMNSTGGIRLRYSPPEIAGMNRQLMYDSIASIVTDGIRNHAYPGAQVLVAKNGHVVYYEAFGYHTYDSLREVNTQDIYDYASVTKVSSALAAVMKLHGEGKFELDAPLQRYFPYMKNSNKGDIPFRSMLAHNARLKSWIPYWRTALRKNARYPWKKGWSDEMINDYNFRWYTFKRDSSKRFPIKIAEDLWLYRKYKEKKIYKMIKKSPLNEQPGYVYSGLLFYLLPEIVADLTGEDYETYLKENIYHPLGAYTMTYNPMRLFPLDRIVPTERDTFFSMQQIHGRVHDEGAAMMDGVSANAGLFSTANDLAKLFQMYMNYGNYGGKQLIAEATLKEFTRCQYCEEGNRRGLGFDKPLIEYNAGDSYVAKDASPASFGHSGYTGTFVWADPENELLFIFFSNRVYPTRESRELYRLGIRPRLHQAMYEAAEAADSGR